MARQLCPQGHDMIHLLHEGLRAASQIFAPLKEKRQIQSSEAPGTSFFTILIGTFISKALCHCNLAILTFGESYNLEGSLVSLLPVVPPNATVVLVTGKREMPLTPWYQWC